MHRIIKNTLLDYFSLGFLTEFDVNPARIFDVNNKKIQNGLIVYLIEREIRAKNNFALQFAFDKAQKLNKNLKIICRKKTFEVKEKNDFINTQILNVQTDFKKINLEMEIFEGNDHKILEYLRKILTSILIIDFNPILNREYLKSADFKIYEIDSHNIIPARFLSDKQEYNAASFRRKIYYNIAPFLTEFKNIATFNENQAEIDLKNFIENKLPFYAEFKNDPIKNVQSGLSKYLNLGFISSQKIVFEVIKANVSKENKEAFLEELIIRKELADNFCLYCKNYRTFDCSPNWAKDTLKTHLNDFRAYIYTKNEFENAKTHEALWNATQKQLMNEGIIHGYLRMYWAKKILEWSKTPQEALETAIYLNDKYAYDAPSADGYTGILWAISALHDRPFQNRPITGKIRSMTYKSAMSKYDISKYIQNYFKFKNN